MTNTFNKTREEARKLWIEALRSGEYKQGKHYLHLIDNGQDQYCCLGVACALYQEHETPLEVREELLEVATPRVRYGDDFTALPPEVQQWLGLAGRLGGFHVDDRDCSLVGLNDQLGKTFAEIADVIESRPQGLFVD